MNNYNDVLEYQQIQLESAGLAAERYESYMGGIEAATNKVTASWEKLISDTISEEFIVRILNLADGILKLVDNVGVLNLAILAVSGVLGSKLLVFIPGLTAMLDGLALSFGASTTAAFAFSSALSVMIPVAALLAGIYVLNELNQTTEELYNSFKANSSESKKAQGDIEALAKEYESLAYKQNKSQEELDRLLSIQSLMNDEYDFAKKGIDLYSAAVDNNTESIRKNIEEIREQKKQTAQDYIDIETSNYEEAVEKLNRGTQVDLSGSGAYTYVDFDERINYLREEIKLGNDRRGLKYDEYQALIKEKAMLVEIIEAYQEQEDIVEDIGSLTVNNVTTLKERIGELSPIIDDVMERMKYGITPDLGALEQGISQDLFAGMTQSAIGSLTEINDAFNQGEMDIIEYSDKLIDVTKIFETLGNTALKFADHLDIDASGYTDAINEMIDGTKELSNMQELNQAVQDAIITQSTGALEFGTEQYNQYMQYLADMSVEAGMTFYDVSGNALSSAEDIYNALTTNSQNFGAFSQQTASRTGEVIEGIAHSIGALLVGIGQSISSFEGRIEFTPYVGGSSGIKLPPVLQELFKTTTLPGIGFEISSGVTAKDYTSAGFNEIVGSAQDVDFASGIGESISAIGQELMNLDITLTDEIYNSPPAFERVEDSAGRVRDAIDSITDSAESMGATTEDAADAEKKALEEQLDAYKDLIDIRKKLLDSLAEERDYKKDLQSKEKELLKVQTELAELAFDTSEEARARRLELEEEYAELQSEIDDLQYERGVDVQKEMLDLDYERFKQEIENKINAIDGISATNLSDFYDQLAQIFTGIAGNEFISGLPGSPEVTPIDSGISFMHGGSYNPNSLPAFDMASASDSIASLAIENLINVEGNLDESVLPEIKVIANAVMEEINRTMSSRGKLRSASSFPI